MIQYTNPLTKESHYISTVLTSTFSGHYGDGWEFPYFLFPGARKLMAITRDENITNICKSATYKKHCGNFRKYRPWTWKYIQRIGDNTMLNAFKLTNPGVINIAPRIAKACARGYNAIPSFYPQFTLGLEIAIKQTCDAINIYRVGMSEYFWALEINGSCPNAEDIKKNMADLLKLAKEIKELFPWLCLIYKISIVHPYEFVQELIQAGVDIIHSINTIPYRMVYPGLGPSPLEAVGGGGVSGADAFRLAYNYNKGLRQALPDARIIMGCGVTNLKTAEAYLTELKADSISICTVCRTHSGRAAEIMEKYKD